MSDGVVNPQARSPYQRYGKSPYRYSPEYERWRAAAMKGDDRAAREADTAWRKRIAFQS